MRSLIQPEAFAGLVATDSRHVDIEQNQMWPIVLSNGQTFFARVRCENSIAVLVQNHGGDTANRRAIIDHENCVAVPFSPQQAGNMWRDRNVVLKRRSEYL